MGDLDDPTRHDGVYYGGGGGILQSADLEVTTLL